MMHPKKIALVLFALLAVPAVACAGPITFNYTTTTSTTQFGSYDPGPLMFSLSPEGSASFPVTTGGSLELGSVEFGPSHMPPSFQTDRAAVSFDVSVTITDGMSGQTGTLTLNGGGVDEWFLREWDGRYTNDFHNLEFGELFGLDRDWTQATIGNTRYTFSVHTVNDDQAAVYELSAAYATPEPGTFALAAVGLVPLGARLVRRRVKIGGAATTPA
jgi:hypothetical protein